MQIRESTEVVEVKKEVGNLPAPIAVINAESMELAKRRVVSDEEAMERIHDRLDESKKRARQVWQDWNDLINELVEPFEKDKEVHVSAVRAYIAEEKRKAEAEESRLREIARQQEEERRLAEAEALEKEGRPEEAAAVIEEPMTIVTPTVKRDVPKYDARTYKDPIPKASVIDKGKFLAWVAASPDRFDLVDVNERKLNDKAKSLRGKIEQVIPGTKYREE